MTKEEIRQAAQDWDGSGMATPAEEGAFIKGAEWMQERMIEKAAGFIYDTIFNWADDSYCQTFSECRMDYIDKFKQAMQDESK